MKKIYELDMEDVDDQQTAYYLDNAVDMAIALREFNSYLRDEIKFGTHKAAKLKALEDIRRIFIDITSDVEAIYD